MFRVGQRVAVKLRPVSECERFFRGRMGEVVSLHATGFGPLVRVRFDDVSGIEDLLANRAVPEALIMPESLLHHLSGVVVNEPLVGPDPFALEEIEP